MADSNSNNTSVSSKVDPKLFHLVKKLANSASGTGSQSQSQSQQFQNRPNVDYIVTVLRTQHREYLRKDLPRLTAQVSVAIQQILGEGDAGAEAAAQVSRKRVRKRKQQPSPAVASAEAEAAADDQDDDEREGGGEERALRDAEEAVYDHQAAENDAQRVRIGAGGGLNAALRDRYKQVSAAASATATPPPPPPSSSSSTTKKKRVSINNNDNVTMEGEDGETNEQSTPATVPKSATATPSAATTTSSSSKRKGTAKLRRQSSSGVGAGGGGAMQDGFNGVPTSFLVAARLSERYSDLGGMHDVIAQLRQLVEYPLVRPELYRHLGVDPPRGVLLRGPPGTGKTHLANAVAGELGVPYFRVSAPELVSGMSGESEGRIRDLFRAAADAAPSLIFMDELDAIAPKRSDASGARGMEKRMVAQLLTSMDTLAPTNNRQGASVLVLAATNRPDALDPALRRAGRFDKEILLGVPDEDARERILRTMTKSMRLSGDFDFKQLARKTPGYVGADIRSLAKEAAVVAIDRIFHDVLKEGVRSSSSAEAAAAASDTTNDKGGNSASSSTVVGITPLTGDQMEPLYITMDDFLNAVPLVQPSSQREGFATVPDVSWENIGALHSIREELTMTVLEPIRSPEKFQALGLTLPAGVLLYGPPGCGKTLLAKAIANESGVNFISVKGPELLDKYVGESERAVRVVFDRARSSSPCVVFFDELDSLVPKRGSDSGGGGVSERVVNQLLTEMDGLDSRRSVFVIAATNRPELIDPAMMRPGRLDKLLYVPLPTPEDRASILKALAVKVVLSEDVDLEAIGMSPRATGYSGADCAALLREAGLAVLKEDAAAHAAGTEQGGALCIAPRHFDRAFESVMPSVSKKDQARYDRIRNRMARARSRSIAEETEVNAEDVPSAVPEDKPWTGEPSDNGTTDDVVASPMDIDAMLVSSENEPSPTQATSENTNEAKKEKTSSSPDVATAAVPASDLGAADAPANNDASS